MDLQISIFGNLIITDVFDKKLNLYIYIPPHSTHPLIFIKVLAIE